MARRPKRTRIGAVVLVALACVASMSSAALSDTRAFRDPDEDPFCEGPGPCPDRDGFDFRRLTQGHGIEYRNVRHGIRFARGWKTKWLGGRYGITIYIDFNLDGDRRRERQIRIRRKDGELWAAMFAGYWKRNRVEGPVRVWRPSQRRLKVGFPVDMLADGIRRYRWDVWEANRGLVCPGSCQNEHTDVFVHRL